jgi:hypothetical protein
MTLTPVSDKGQRYEVSSWGDPFQGEKCVIGWTEELMIAAKMAQSIALAPGCLKWSIRDRWNKTPEWPGGEYVQMVGAMGLR